MFTEIDTWLINRVFQPIVDWSEKQPAWWYQQCIGASAVAYAIGLVLYPAERLGDAFDWAWVAFMAFLFVGMFRDSANPALLAGRGPGLRWMLVGVAAVGLVISVSKAEPDLPASIAFNVVFTAAFFFAACKPPRPRLPRGKLAFGL